MGACWAKYSLGGTALLPGLGWGLGHILVSAHQQPGFRSVLARVVHFLQNVRLLHAYGQLLRHQAAARCAAEGRGPSSWTCPSCGKLPMLPGFVVCHAAGFGLRRGALAHVVAVVRPMPFTPPPPRNAQRG